jgi:UDP-glucose 4-epimerase
MARRVLITGVSRHLGGRLAQLLSASPEVEVVVGVDTTTPKVDLGRTEFVRADIRNPIIAKVLSTERIDTVVHMNLIATPGRAGGRTAMKEINVIGTMQLLAACQKAPAVRRLIVKSSTAIYGSSSRDPAIFTEDSPPRGAPSGFAKDAVEVEGYVRGFGRRRPDVSLTVLRFTNFIGPHLESSLTRYLSLPVVPTVLGYDPRIQLCHEDDALEVLRLAALTDRSGIVNVGGAGQLLLSQAIRRAGRLWVTVPTPAVTVTGDLLRRAKLIDVSPEQIRFLEHGRVADVTRLRDVFGYQARYTSATAFDDWVATAGLRIVDPDVVEVAERLTFNTLRRGHARLAQVLGPLRAAAAAIPLSPVSAVSAAPEVAHV